MFGPKKLWCEMSFCCVVFNEQLWRDFPCACWCDTTITQGLDHHHIVLRQSIEECCMRVFPAGESLGLYVCIRMYVCMYEVVAGTHRCHGPQCISADVR